MTAEYCFARVSNADAEAAANELCGPPVDSHVSRAYSLGRVDFHALVDFGHPNQADRRRKLVAFGRAFGGAR